jgi:hypothetical protein
MKILSKAVERRRHKRLAVMGSPVAIMKPGPSRPGKVTRISATSVEIIYDSIDSERPAETGELDILAADFVRPVYLERLPVRMVSDSATSGNTGPPVRKRVLAFDRMTADQHNQLQSFIYSFAY